jgi:RES domain-containing protein
MHRLIPSQYSESGTVLEEIADDDKMLEQLILLDGATNDRIQGEQSGLSGISTYELVYGIPNDYIIRAAFLHTSESGGRFNDGTRGAWYAADKAETSLDEVSYHKARRLADIVVPELPGSVPDSETSTYDDWLADFHADFHMLEPSEQYAKYLLAEPVPQCYLQSQRLARDLIRRRSNGIIYPSVRRRSGTCLVCFRPALVYQPRRGRRYEIHFKWDGKRYRKTIRPVVA